MRGGHEVDKNRDRAVKAIFPCSYYLPETAASLYITDNIVHGCADDGVDVDLYTPTPTRGVPADALWRRTEVMAGGHIRVHRFHLYGEGRSPVLRAVRYFLGELILLHYCMWKEYDVAFIDSTPPIQGLKIPFIKWIRRKPVVYNAQDIFPDSLVGAGLAGEGSILWKIGRIIEKITYRYADRIIVISEDFKRNIMAKGVPEEKIEVIYNWVDQNAVVDVPRRENKLFDRYGLDRDRFYVTYSGNIGLTQNMDLLLCVAEDIMKEYDDIHFVLVGDGAYLDEVKRKVSGMNLVNVHLLPFQPYDDISHVFSLGDASLVISKPGVGANSVPSKTWSIMSASRPVLVNFDENELKEIVEGRQCGIFTMAGDMKSLKESILTLYRNRELCRLYGRNGRQFVMDHLTREVGTARYVEVIKSVVKK